MTSQLPDSAYINDDKSAVKGGGPCVLTMGFSTTIRLYILDNGYYKGIFSLFMDNGSPEKSSVIVRSTRYMFCTFIILLLSSTSGHLAPH